jgi:hypothetical protein
LIDGPWAILCRRHTLTLTRPGFAADDDDDDGEGFFSVLIGLQVQNANYDPEN